MKKIYILILTSIIVGLGLLIFQKFNSNKRVVLAPQKNSVNTVISAIDQPLYSIIAKNIDTPWAIAFLPDKSMLVTERKGTVIKISTDNSYQPKVVATISQAKEKGEGGLLGIALHPDFQKNHFVYFYYTFQNDGENTSNRVVKMVYKNDQLEDETVIVDNIPGASNHNGGKIKFGPDGYLYITTGDAQNPSQAQDTGSLAGKILRVTDEGKPAVGNPFKNLVYSYGHRNPQGIAWNQDGTLFATEHGRSGVQSGLDEINIIKTGKNYGWPAIQGDETKTGMQSPVVNSGASSTWAPAGADFVGNSLFFGGLRGQGLYEVVFEGEKFISMKEHFIKELGRIREVVLGPDNMLYITTSNRDGRGNPSSQDDLVIRVNTKKTIKSAVN